MSQTHLGRYASDGPKPTSRVNRARLCLLAEIVYIFTELFVDQSGLEAPFVLLSQIAGHIARHNHAVSWGTLILRNSR